MRREIEYDVKQPGKKQNMQRERLEEELLEKLWQEGGGAWKRNSENSPRIWRKKIDELGKGMDEIKRSATDTILWILRKG